MGKKIIHLILLIIIIGAGFFYNYSLTKTNQWNLDDDVVKNNIYYSTYPSILEIYRTKKVLFNVDEINNEKDKIKFDKNLKNILLELMHMPFSPLKNPKETLIEQIDKGKYIQKKLRLYITSNTFSSAFLLIPKNLSSPAPAVIAMHSHGNNYNYGKEEVVGNIGDPNLFYGKELAENGYIVLAMDAPLFGEDKGLLSLNSPNIDEQFSVRAILSLGYSPLGIIVQNDIASLNYLYSLKDVDKNNIGCIGHSMGGIRCMYLSALDKRIKVNVISNSVANLKPDFETAILRTWLTLLPGVAKYTETSGILALITPRPLMIVYSENDPIFPKNEAETQIKTVKDLYKRLKKEENFVSIMIPNEIHAFPKQYRNQSYNFLDKNLKTE